MPDPESETVLEEFDLTDRALSVSGNTSAYTRHIIDARNGKANADNKLTAVLCPDPLDAEVMSTVSMIASSLHKIRMARQFNNMRIYTYEL